MDTELVEIWRGDLRESVHRGHAVVCDDSGQIVQAWGDPSAVIYPRSSAKPLQALALVESGGATGLSPQQLALSCASHNGAAIHSGPVRNWLADLGLGEADLRCGRQEPADIPARNDLVCSGHSPDQTHNNCSGKHTGFLTLNKHLGGGSEYIDIDHPVQIAVKAAVEETVGEDSPTWAIDGCSAPNHACTLTGLARAGARFAAAEPGNARSSAMVRLRDAMMTHPDLVAGEGRACTRMMRACAGQAALKTGAEGVFFAALPKKKMGVALKISDGTSRAAEAALAAILVMLGVADPRDPEIGAFFYAPITNRRDIKTGEMRPAAALQNRTLGRLG